LEYKAVAFTGPSGSGKTTLIEKIAKELVKSKRVAIIKHDPSSKAKFDKEGKDSYRFFQTGADVAVLSPTQTTLFSHRAFSIKEAINLFGEFDLLMVEGLKELPLPRIGVFRGKLDNSYFDYIQALAIDDSIDIDSYNLPKDLDILDLNDTKSIIEWIDKNGTSLKGEIKDANTI